MDRISVESSMMLSIGYDENDAVLEIEFKSNGQVWQYYDVPEYVFQNMMGSESVGKYFHSDIKGKYKEARV